LTILEIEKIHILTKRRGFLTQVFADLYFLKKHENRESLRLLQVKFTFNSVKPASY